MALRRGESCIVETETCDTIADGLAIRRPLAPNVAAIRELVDEIVAVSEQQMLDAIIWLRDRESVIAEPAGAAATAAFLGASDRTRGTCAPARTGPCGPGADDGPARDRLQLGTRSRAPAHRFSGASRPHG